MTINKYRYLQIFYLVRFIGDALFYAFFSIYLNSINKSTLEITIVTSLIPLVSLAGGIVFRKLAKTINLNRVLMIVIASIEGFSILLYLIIGNISFPFVIILTILTSSINSSFYQLQDGYGATYLANSDKSYQGIRSIGSFSYFIGVMGGGFLVGLTNYNLLYSIAAVFILASGVFAYFLPKADKILSKVEVIKDENPPKLAYSPSFLIFLLWSLLIVSLATASDNFFGVYLDSVGIDSSGFGYITGVAYFLEGAVMLILTRIKKPFKNVTLAFVVIGLLASIRFFSVGFHANNGAASNVFLIVSSFSRGIGWGMLLAFNVNYLSRIVPMTNLTKALFTTSVVTTFGRSVGGFILGQGVEKLGYNATYRIFAMFIIITLLFIGVLSFLNEKKLKKKTKEVTI